jgi:hypothetical protein
MLIYLQNPFIQNQELMKQDQAVNLTRTATLNNLQDIATLTVG